MLNLDPAAVRAKVAEGWTLLDVRSDAEWADGHIDGSEHIPMDQLLARLDEVGDEVVCVCAVGARSERVAHFLQSQGRMAANLDGGLQAWVWAGGSLTS